MSDVLLYAETNVKKIILENVSDYVKKKSPNADV